MIIGELLLCIADCEGSVTIRNKMDVHYGMAPTLAVWVTTSFVHYGMAPILAVWVMPYLFTTEWLLDWPFG